MDGHNFYLAKPGDPNAARAIARSQQSDDMAIWLPLGTLGFFGVMAIFYNLPKNWWTVAAFLVVVLSGTGFMAYKFVKPSKSPLQHAIEAGTVIEVDSYLVEAWDKLRNRLGIKLTKRERRQALKNLFYVAHELRGKLWSYRELENEPELQDERLEIEAYIRARLLREVQELGAYKQGARELDKAATPLQLESVSPEEVAAELAILKDEQSTPDDTPFP